MDLISVAWEAYVLLPYLWLLMIMNRKGFCCLPYFFWESFTECGIDLKSKIDLNMVVMNNIYMIHTPDDYLTLHVFPKFIW